MAPLRIRFARSLKRWDVDRHFRAPEGPVFSGWLPDGDGDALTLELNEQDAVVALWFRRYGEVDGSFVKYDAEKDEVDPEVMETQLGLDAGPLWGEVRLEELDRATFRAVEENRRGTPEYESLGKRVLKRIIEPEVDRFLAVLRKNFGQYWLRGLDRWDSRERSLGHACHLMNMRWSSDGGESWNPFRPNEPETTPDVFQATLSYEIRELTEEDWRALEIIWRSGYEPSFGAEVLMRAHEHLREEDLKFALVEGVTALEIAVEEFADRNLAATEAVAENVDSFVGTQALSLKIKLTVLATAAELVDPKSLEDVYAAIDLRNDVVHEGAEVGRSDADLIWSLLETVAELLHGPTFRFPAGYVGRASLTPDSWTDVSKPELDLDCLDV